MYLNYCWNKNLIFVVFNWEMIFKLFVYFNDRFILVDTVIMGDVIYGVCCVDDFIVRVLGVDLMVYYGYSCLG